MNKKSWCDTFWKPTDRTADWLAEKLGPRNQLRMGIWMVGGSIPLFLYAPFSGEPVFIYLMSAAALTFGGVSVVVGAEVLENQEKED